MEATFQKLLGHMQELRDLWGLIGLATWDQETYLPPKAEPARGSQLATLQAVYHEKLCSPALGELLAHASERTDLTGDQRAMIRVLSWERNRKVKMPEALVRALAQGQSRALSAWRAAREARNFAMFKPALEHLLQLRREQADAIGYQGDRYDALLDEYEPGMTVARLTPVLSALKDKLVPMVQKLSAKGVRQPEDVFAGKTFDPERQWRYTMKLLPQLGFDLEAGRQDRSVHPFTGGTHPRDVRLTTRLDPTTPLPAIFGTIHEAGHGLYEQGFAEEHHRTPLATSPSMGLHESQSRLWENIVGRSKAFWQPRYAELQAEFPEQLGKVSLEQFHRAINRVSPTFIRVEADEVTYNLHIVLRYELELLLIKGELPVDQLPSEWNARTERLLGIRPTHDTEGVLQDIHWAWGEYGYFPTYSLGNLYSASLYAAAKRDVPQLEERIAEGRLDVLLGWLKKNIHAQGFRLPAEELVRKVTGRGITDEDFVQYLRGKYSALYGVDL